MLDELNAIDDIFVPSGVGEVGEEADKADDDADAPGWDPDYEAYGYACYDCYGCLAVVVAGEEAGVLEGAVGAYDCELGAAEDGVGFEGCVLE